MRRNKWMRVLSLILGCSIMFSAACGKGQGGNSQPDQSAGEDSNVQEETGANSDAADNQELITLRWGLAETIGTGNSGVFTDDNYALQKIKEDLGIEIEWVYYNKEKYNLWSAGGDLPDILLVDDGNPAAIASLVESKQFLKLDDLMAKYGQNISKNAANAIIAHNRNYDGTYLMPVGISDKNSIPDVNAFSEVAFRYDIYEAIGSPKMENLDDVLEVFKQMQDYERQRTGSDDVYAMSAFVDMKLWYYYCAFCYSNGWESLGNFLEDNLETGEIKSLLYCEDSNLWKSMEFFNKAYRMGIFDTDGLTMTWAQNDEKVSNGKVLTTFHFVHHYSMNPEACGEDAIMTCLPGGFEYIPYLYGRQSPAGSAGRAITSNCKYPERAMQLLDYLDDPTRGARLVKDGIEGMTWEIGDDGMARYMDDALDAYARGEGNDYMKPYSLDQFGTIYLYSDSIKDENGRNVDLSKSSEFCELSLDAAQKKFSESYGCSYPGEVYEKWVADGLVKTNEDSNKFVLYTVLMDPLPNEMANTLEEAGDYMMSNIAKLIMADTDEDFAAEKEAIMNKFSELGLEEIWQTQQQNHEAAKQLYEELFQ